MSLTPKQEAFCQEYLVDLNATQAAIRAGYSEKTAREQGCQNLTKLNVQERVAELMAKREKRTQINQDRVLQEYARLAFLDPRKFFDENGNLINVSDLDDDTAAALAGLEITTERDKESEDLSFTKKIKLIDKKGALDSIARHLGMFNDKLGISGDITITQKKYEFPGRSAK